MLVLAGTDRLDKELTIAQMQGKFQFEVMGGGVGSKFSGNQESGEYEQRVLTHQ